MSEQYKPALYTNKELVDFEGSYYSKELGVDYTLIRENDLLMLYINETKKSALNSIMENMFINDYYGTFQFKTDSNRKVVGFTLAAGRVKNLFFEKK